MPFVVIKPHVAAGVESESVFTSRLYARDVPGFHYNGRQQWRAVCVPDNKLGFNYGGWVELKLLPGWIGA